MVFEGDFLVFGFLGAVFGFGFWGRFLVFWDRFLGFGVRFLRFGDDFFKILKIFRGRKTKFCTARSWCAGSPDVLQTFQKILTYGIGDWSRFRGQKGPGRL